MSGCFSQKFSNYLFLMDDLFLFSLMFIYKRFNIWNFLDVIQFLHNLMQQFTTYWKHLSSVFVVVFLGGVGADFLLLFSFLFSLESQYMNDLVEILLYDIYNTKNCSKSKIKSFPFIDVSKLIWYLEQSDSKSSLATSFTSV